MTVATSADGARVVTGSRGNLVQVWDAKTRACFRFLQCRTTDYPGIDRLVVVVVVVVVVAIAMSADGASIVIAFEYEGIC